MGKKRNNAAKKKQVSKKKLSSSYGVSVLKGGTKARNNGAIDATTTSLTRRNQTTQRSNASKSHHSGDSNKCSLQNCHPSPISLTENDEFHRLHASLEERSLILQSQRDHQRKSKKFRQNQKNGWGKFARPTPTMGPNLSPATLTLAPKTTQQLIDDTTDQVAEMSDIGQRLSTITKDGSGKSSLAAAAGLDWKINAVKTKSEQTPSQLNSYAVLDDDSDNDWVEKKISVNVQPLQFQPASFSFQSGSCFNPIGVPASVDDIDPDL